ncbi:hypothetical protein VPFG_00276 [Vibrio phage nt-1]|uniref:Uncharacterized protein n=1 Tax=Vibrio phage nt-1 TaxID=115992 RepID=R9TIR4_9CAUD|nr:hypothetical protein VPFG_00276 [Vibrio phage nt-1]AGN30275.1 hypothetical protein VPFG_00276 [Vibrio phage nt-1]
MIDLIFAIVLVLISANALSVPLVASVMSLFNFMFRTEIDWQSKLQAFQMKKYNGFVQHSSSFDNADFIMTSFLDICLGAIAIIVVAFILHAAPFVCFLVPIPFIIRYIVGKVKK